jgi:hypothetical protein
LTRPTKTVRDTVERRGMRTTISVNGAMGTPPPSSAPKPLN